MKKRYWAIVAIAGISALVALSPDPPSSADAEAPADLFPARPGYVSSETVDFTWPLSVEEGVLSCEPPSAVVFETRDGTRYAVNGMAESHAERLRLEDIEPIWMEDPTFLEETGYTREELAEAGMSVPRIPLELINVGLELCE
jgi:hypothetical protein